MSTKISYLFLSETGFFEYRRRVPPKLQQHFPRNSKGNLLTEWKKALDTKIESVAQRRWVVENERFEATKRLAEQLLHGEPPKAQKVEQSAISSAKQMAVKYGVHPDQAPALGIDATEEDIQNFPQKIKEWKLKVQEHQELLLDIISEEYIDEEQRAKDYHSGRWGKLVTKLHTSQKTQMTLYWHNMQSYLAKPRLHPMPLGQMLPNYTLRQTRGPKYVCQM